MITVETIAIEVIASCADLGGQLMITVEAIASCADPGGGGGGGGAQ